MAKKPPDQREPKTTIFPSDWEAQFAKLDEWLADHEQDPCFVGIDLGHKGALTFVAVNQLDLQSVCAIDMPGSAVSTPVRRRGKASWSIRNDYDFRRLRQLMEMIAARIYERPLVTVFSLEKPLSGGMTAHQLTLIQMWRIYGWVECWLGSLPKARRYEALPQAWQGFYDVAHRIPADVDPKKRSATMKDVTCGIFQALYVDAERWTEFPRELDGRSEAGLVALLGLAQHAGLPQDLRIRLREAAMPLGDLPDFVLSKCFP